jgi:hypothetical protein
MFSNNNISKDPGQKKNDGYSKQVKPEKIVNEQDQDKVSNMQGIPASSEQNDAEPKQEVIENVESHLSDKATEESEHVTPETLEEDRKHSAGLNA